MRVAFSGTASTGKSTLVNAFHDKWPMHQRSNKTYRDIIVENGLSHSSKTNDETQLIILNWMMEELDNNKNKKYYLYDRCPWDNLAYTLHGNSKGTISDETAAASISFVKESMKQLDIIFWLPYTDKIKVVADGMRDADVEYIKEVDTIFQDLYHHYADNLEQGLFYPPDDCPAIIPIEDGWLTVDDRLFFISQFIDRNGDLIETKPGGSILEPDNVELMENMLEDQVKQFERDQEVIKIMENPDNKFKL